MHESVLLNESLDGLAIKQDGIYVDGTFGRGGHSGALLKRLGEHGRLIAIDKDPEAIKYAHTHFTDKRFSIHQGSFADMHQIAETCDVLGKVDGILLDLGVSSPQLDNADRGFSFTQAGPLDMRMDLTQPLDAALFVKEASEKELEHTFREYGEERYAGRIARAIVRERDIMPIKTTLQLADIVKEANPNWEKHKHPATRVFQAIRIHINRELADLQVCLEQSLDVLATGGRLSVISFHSLEDRMVKRFMRSKAQGPQLPKSVPIKDVDIKTNFKRIGKAIKPTNDEVKSNVRARSAILRIGEKIG